MKNKLFPNIKRLTTIFSIAILGITLLLIGLRLTAFSDLATAAPKNDATSASGASVDENANGILGTPENAESGEGAVAYSINRHIYFSSPEAAGDIQIENPEASPYDIRVSVTRNDNGKTVYVSGALRPGSAIQTAKIQGARLPEGAYECTADVSTYEVGTSTKVGSTQVPVSIYIGEEYAP